MRRLTVALGILVCLIGILFCDTLIVKNYIKQQSASELTDMLSVKTRSKIECATFCSRKESHYSFTFDKTTKACYCAESAQERYLDSSVLRKMDACLSNTGYQFESKIGVCYKLEGNSLVIADDAKAICASEGGHLVTIMEEEMNDFFVNLVSAPEYNATWRFFIDGSDVETEGIWKLSNGEVMTWSDWRPGEPYAHTGSNCVEFFRPSELKWVMVSCTSSSRIGGYICQIDV